MCTPQAYAAARSVAKKRDAMTIEGVNLNNLKDTPRQLALTTATQFKPLAGISLGQISDPTMQSQGSGSV